MESPPFRHAIILGVDDAIHGQLSCLWAEHRSALFPGRLRGLDVAGVDMVMLDGDIAGCISSLLSTDSLDQRRRAILKRSIRDLQSVLPLLTVENELAYYDRLRAMAELAASLDS